LFSINGQSWIISCKSDLGRPCSGKYLSFGQKWRSRVSNEVRLCMQLGKAFRFSQSNISSLVSLVEGNPPSGNDSRFGHCSIRIS
ncbi:hypothetical protein CUMW_083120, partial [Citrus unshiu]